MDTTISHRPIAAMISLTAAVTLTVSTTAPSATASHTPPAPHVVTQAVALAANPLEQIWDVFTGVDTSHPLPAGANPIAPITEQVLRSVATYSGELLSGQGHLIPGEISAQVKTIQDALPVVQELLIDDIGVIPAAVFSAFFLTALVIASLPASAATALPGLIDIWLRAVFYPPLKWVYNGFAIRNLIAGTGPAPGVIRACATKAAPAKRALTSKRSAKPTAASSTATRAKTGVAGSQRQRPSAP